MDLVNHQKGPQILSKHGAMAPGSTLWVVPNKEESQWTSTLDWYMNYQITRASLHKRKTLAPTIKQIISESEFQLKSLDFEEEDPLLMIACEQQVPALMLLRIPNENNHQKWMKRIYDIWTKMDSPTLRIFLPFDFPMSQFKNFWPEPRSIDEITLVPSNKSEN